jgi:tetratricopeptide (TPR) repeat protein
MMNMKWLNIAFFFLAIPQIKSQTAEYYLNRADKKIEAKDYQGALETLQRGAENFSNDASLYSRMGFCEKKLGHYLSAAKIFAYAKALDSRKENAIIDGALKISSFFSKH